MPEVATEEAGEAYIPAGSVPQCHSSLAIVAFPRVNILLGPDVHHVLDSVHEGVREDGAEVAGQSSAEELDGSRRVVADAPDDGELVDQPVVAVEGSEGQQSVLHEERESVAEQVVWALLKWNASYCVPETGVALLQFGRESAISSVSTQSHLAGHCEGRGHQESCEGGGHLAVEAVFEAAEVDLPAGVELPKSRDLESHVEEGAEQSEVTAVAHALVEGLEIGNRAIPRTCLRERVRCFVVLGQQFGAADEVADVLLKVGGDQSDHDACVFMCVPRWQFQLGVESTAVCQPVVLFRPNVGSLRRRISSSSKNILSVCDYYYKTLTQLQTFSLYINQCITIIFQQNKIKHKNKSEIQKYILFKSASQIIIENYF